MLHEPTPLTDRFDRALLYATHVHGGQVRKQTSVPYIAHLLAVAATVLEYGGDEDMAIAGLLHDTAEDQGGEQRLADVRNRFGAEVGRIVYLLSDHLLEQDSGLGKPPWPKRKQAYVKRIREEMDSRARLVSLSDKVHNARSILRDLRNEAVGQKVWERFSKPREDVLWYYGELAAAFLDCYPGQLARELDLIVQRLREE